MCVLFYILVIFLYQHMYIPAIYGVMNETHFVYVDNPLLV